MLIISALLDWTNPEKKTKKISREGVRKDGLYILPPSPPFGGLGPVSSGRRPSVFIIRIM